MQFDRRLLPYSHRGNTHASNSLDLDESVDCDWNPLTSDQCEGLFPLRLRCAALRVADDGDVARRRYISFTIVHYRSLSFATRSAAVVEILFKTGHCARDPRATSSSIKGALSYVVET